MKDLIFKNWNLIRFIRLGFGLFILVQAVIETNILIGLAGLLFTSMAVFNAGCGSSGTCTPSRSRDKVVSKDITYEEVK